MTKAIMRFLMLGLFGLFASHNAMAADKTGINTQIEYTTRVHDTGNTTTSGAIIYVPEVYCASCSGGGGGGGAVTAASGSYATGFSPDIGTPSDTSCATDSGLCDVIQLLKRDNVNLTTLTTALGTPLQAGGTVVVTQTTAANLNATVTGTVAATQSGTWTDTVTQATAANLNATVVGTTGTGSDAMASTSTAITAFSEGALWNGTSYDRQRSAQGANGTGIGVVAVQGVPVSAASASITPVTSASATATSLILKASAGNFYDGYCYSSAAGNCILVNSATVPATGAITAALVIDCAPVAANGYGAFNYNGGIPERGTAGLTLIFTSVTGPAGCYSYTSSATAIIKGRAQ